MTPGQRRAAAAIEAELARLIRYDDESVVHEAWIRQRYQGGFAASYAPARSTAVQTAWHEAGHAVAALEVGARFSSASIRGGGRGRPRGGGLQPGGGWATVLPPPPPRARSPSACGTGRCQSRTGTSPAGWPAGTPTGATRGGSGPASGTGSATT